MFGRFYAVDMLSYPLIDAAIILTCSAAAIVWFRIRKRRNRAACSAELEKIEGGDTLD